MKPNIYLIVICIILFLIAILFGVLLNVSTNEMGKAIDRIDQLTKINQLLDTRGKTDIADLTTTTTTIKTLDDETLEFVTNYSSAQGTYIDLLQGILKNNHIFYPEFEYKILLEDAVQ